ncbi:MAG: amylosucrase, partial [Pararheinheimera sp.]|nr:amylosucrase [Rheinheimera sp.]
MQKTTAQLLDNPELLHFESQKTLKRLSASLKAAAKDSWPELKNKLEQQLPALLELYLSLYADHYD